MAALPLIVFDVNETLLDLRSLEPTFERISRDKAAMRLWFANLIMYSAALDDSRMLCAIHGHRFGCDEDAR
jgi:2-haloacid dehalogenase